MACHTWDTRLFGRLKYLDLVKILGLERQLLVNLEHVNNPCTGKYRNYSSHF